MCLGRWIVRSRGGRSPHGERGLKCSIRRRLRVVRQSLSSWRAWIEMVNGRLGVRTLESRSPHGERGLKYECIRAKQYPQTCRSPHGERGLK